MSNTGDYKDVTIQRLIASSSRFEDTLNRILVDFNWWVDTHRPLGPPDYGSWIDLIRETLIGQATNCTELENERTRKAKDS